MSSKAQADQQQASLNAQADETNRNVSIAETAAAQQQALSKQGQAVVSNQVNAQSAPAQQVARDADATVQQGKYDTNATGAINGSYLPTTPGAPKIISDQVGQKLASALTTQKGENAAKAQLDAVNDLNVQNQASNAQSGNLVNQFQNFRAGQYGTVLPAQYVASSAAYNDAMAHAAGTDSTLKLLGAVTSAAGSVVGGAGAAGALGAGVGGNVASGANTGLSALFQGLNWNGTTNPYMGGPSSYTGSAAPQ